MPNQIQVGLGDQIINLAVSDDQMELITDDGREYVAVDNDENSSAYVCESCSFNKLNYCGKIPFMHWERNDGRDHYFVEVF